MEFGFLPDSRRFDFDNVEIKPRHDYDVIMGNFYKTANVSDGWIYPCLETKKPNMGERRKFERASFYAEPGFFTVLPTHTIKIHPYDPQKARFLILSYGFLLGLYLSPVGYLCINRLAYEAGKLTGVIPMHSDYSKGMSSFSSFYDRSDDPDRKQMFAILHWFLVGQSYKYAWDCLDAQYKVLDGFFRLAKLDHCAHTLRPLRLAREYDIAVPKWAQEITVCKKKTTRLAVLRNELLHEARFAGEPIGYDYPKENLCLELVAFNVKLVASSIGLTTPYVKAAPDCAQLCAWDLA